MRRLGIAAFVLLLGTGIIVLRETTMSVHRDVPEPSHLDVWVTAATYVREDPELRLTRAQVDLCTAEAVPTSRLVAFEEVPAAEDDQVYRFRVTPGFDAPDRAQLRGCLEDLRVGHLRLEVRGTRQTVRGETTTVTGRAP